MIVNGYELFSDSAYYDMIAVRPVGNRNFADAVHFDTMEKAINYANSITFGK